MKRFVLDASSILRMTDQEHGFARVRDLFHAAARNEVDLVISAVNWGEVVRVLHRKHDSAKARLILSNLLTLPMTVMSVDVDDVEAAGVFAFAFKVPYADAFAGSMAQKLSRGAQSPATLVTADNDFRSLPKGTISIEFLPNK